MFSSMVRSHPHKFLKTLIKGTQRAVSSCGKTLNIVMAALTTIYTLLPNYTLHTEHTSAVPTVVKIIPKGDIYGEENLTFNNAQLLEMIEKITRCISHWDLGENASNQMHFLDEGEHAEQSCTENL